MTENRPALLDADERTAFVTGAAGGIGRACVKMLLSSGANVIATDQVAPPDLHDKLMPVALDVTKENDVARALSSGYEQFGSLDYIIHAAGIVGNGPIDQVSREDWHKVIDTNLTSAFFVLKHAYPLLCKPGGAAVLFGSSNASNGGSHLSGPAYASAKAALINLNRYCAKEWAPQGVRINAISPGPTDTPMLDRLSAEEHAQLKAALPLGRYATPEECAAAALFLCSDHAASITGTNLNISSGLVME